MVAVGVGVRWFGTGKQGVEQMYGKGWKEVVQTGKEPKVGVAGTADSKEAHSFGMSGNFGNCSEQV